MAEYWPVIIIVLQLVFLEGNLSSHLGTTHLVWMEKGL